MPALLTPRQFDDAVGNYGWRVVGGGACICLHEIVPGRGADSLTRSVVSMAWTAMRTSICADVVVVGLVTITQDQYRLTATDLELAQRIAAVAREITA
ncbi:hypothetical protein GCM10009616_37930 [Microlunatus lacustris]